MQMSIVKGCVLWGGENLMARNSINVMNICVYGAMKKAKIIHSTDKMNE